MRNYVSVSAYVDVDIDLSEIDDDALLEEVDRRKLRCVDLTPEQFNESLTKIWELRHLNKPYGEQLDDLLRTHLGKAV